MTRVSTGHYRDMFMRTVFDVRRCTSPWGGREAAWEYTIFRPEGDINNGTWTTKGDAARAARVAIADLLAPKYVPGETWPTEHCGAVWAGVWSKK